MPRYTFTQSQLDAFKRQWPCHGIADDVTQVTFWHDAFGNLIDIETLDAEGREVDHHESDGSAMAALSLDARTLANGGQVGWQ